MLCPLDALVLGVFDGVERDKFDDAILGTFDRVKLGPFVAV